MVETFGLIAGLVHHCGTCSGRTESFKDGNKVNEAAMVWVCMLVAAFHKKLWLKA